ncbi:MAG: sulfatase-like hydrolase/transferase [Verrucomicrobiota bacterium]
MKPHWIAFSLVLWLAHAHAAETQSPAKKPVNLLFIMTDQQRWDAMSCAGNTAIRTPNFDKLASQGARFSRFYSACPVCTPARTVILTGHSIESNHVLSNNDAEKTNAASFPTFDQILLRHGYRGEYHGKFHSPYQYALGYSQPVRWLNGKKAPAGCEADISESEAYVQFVAENTAKKTEHPARPGQIVTRNGNYTPIPLDESYGKNPTGKLSQAEMYGRLELSPEFSRVAFTAKEGIAALERLKDGPFTLTISIGPPHPPLVVSEPYYSLYPPERIPVPASINDSRGNSPYSNKRADASGAYRNPTNIQQMTSIYYGMVTEVDVWIGKILQRLDELGLANDTLVIFTSDHGEMLGDHGMHSKGVFYEGAAHVPLLMRLPGVIPPGNVIQTPASHNDMLATVLDYCGQPGHESEGQSLRPLIAGQESGAGRVAISEWASQGVPGFMVFDGRWKLLHGRSKDAPSLDAFYDLKNDPHEMNNLIGRNPGREKSRAEVERLKGLLIVWLAHIKSPWLESVRARPIFK